MPFLGAITKALLQFSAFAAPQLAEVQPSLLEPEGKDIPQSVLRINGLGVFGDAHTAIAIKTQELSRQGFLPQSCLQEPGDIPGVKRENLFPPEVMGHFLHQGLRVIVE